MDTTATIWVSTPAGDGAEDAWAPWVWLADFCHADDAHAFARQQRTTYHGHLFAVRTDRHRPVWPQGATGEARRLALLVTLQAIDRNGTWTDEACDAEGIDRCSLADAEAALAHFTGPEHTAPAAA